MQREDVERWRLVERVEEGRLGGVGPVGGAQRGDAGFWEVRGGQGGEGDDDHHQEGVGELGGVEIVS